MGGVPASRDSRCSALPAEALPRRCANATPVKRQIPISTANDRPFLINDFPLQVSQFHIDKNSFFMALESSPRLFPTSLPSEAEILALRYQLLLLQHSS